MEGRVHIVGYGNTQRGDDGVGPLVVQRLRSSLGPKPWLRFFLYHQLEEGLLENLGDASMLILVDASAEDTCHGVQWRKLEPRPTPSAFSHHMDPATLLWLLRLARGSCPETWLVSIRGENFAQGQEMSSMTLCLALRAQREIEAFLSRIVPRDRTSWELKASGLGVSGAMLNELLQGE
ncbi:MAG: hydrogenase maturation protease [bacterium]